VCRQCVSRAPGLLRECVECGYRPEEAVKAKRETRTGVTPTTGLRPISLEDKRPYSFSYQEFAMASRPDLGAGFYECRVLRSRVGNPAQAKCEVCKSVRPPAECRVLVGRRWRSRPSDANWRGAEPRAVAGQPRAKTTTTCCSATFATAATTCTVLTRHLTTSRRATGSARPACVRSPRHPARTRRHSHTAVNGAVQTNPRVAVRGRRTARRRRSGGASASTSSTTSAGLPSTTSGSTARCCAAPAQRLGRTCSTQCSPLG
jgi:hypothetical protein